MSMGWARTNHSRGLVASWPQSASPAACFWPTSPFCIQPAVGRQSWPGAGTPSRSASRWSAWPLHPLGHSGGTRLCQAGRRTQDRARADASRHQGIPEHNCLRRWRAWPNRRRSTSSPLRPLPTASTPCRCSPQPPCSARRWQPRSCRSASIPVFGHLSDRIGPEHVHHGQRRRTGTSGFIYFTMLQTGSEKLITSAAIDLFGSSALTCCMAAKSALIAGKSMGRLRYSGSPLADLSIGIDHRPASPADL